MMTVQQVTRGRRLGLCLLAAAGMAAPPLLLHAEPATPSGIVVSQPPLTVRRPDGPDVAARREANRARILDARLERLRAGLQLTSSQAALWAPVADAVHGFVKARGFRFRQRIEAAASSNDGLKMQGDHLAAIGAAMSRLADATKPLVASLTADQKSRLPTLLERAGPRKVLARAFDVPLPENSDAAGRGSNGFDAGASGGADARGASLPARGTAAMPGKEPADAGTTSPKKDPDDDDQ